MIIILIVAAVLSGVTSVWEGEPPTDVFIILFIVILNSVLGVVQESKAEKAIDALNDMPERITFPFGSAISLDESRCSASKTCSLKGTVAFLLSIFILTKHSPHSITLLRTNACKP